MTQKNQKIKGLNSETNGFKYAILAVIAIAVAAIIAVVVSQNSKDGAWTSAVDEAPKNLSVTRENLGDEQGEYIMFSTNKDAEHVISVFSDPRCPVCHEFEEQHEDNIEKLVAEGKVALRIHMVSFLDEKFGGDYSARVVAALNELADNDSPEVAWKFYSTLWKNFPSPQAAKDKLPTNDDLAQMARELGAKETSVEAITKVTDTSSSETNDTNLASLKEITGSVGVPTVFVNGILQENALDPGFLDELLEDRVPEDAMRIDDIHTEYLLKLGQGDQQVDFE